MADTTRLTPDWASLTPVHVQGSAAMCSDGRLGLPSSAGPITLSCHHNGMRLRIGHSRHSHHSHHSGDNAEPRPDYGIVLQQPACLVPQLTLSPGKQEICWGQDHILTLTETPFFLSLTCAGRPCLQSADDLHFAGELRLPALARVEGGWLLCCALSADEAVYGLGEKWGRLNRRGQLLRSNNQDALGVNAEISYKNIPFAWSPGSADKAPWGIFVHTPAAVTHAVGYAPWSQRSYCLFIEEEELDVFLFTGQNGAELLQHYTELTGRAPEPPRWSLGTILSKAYYRTEAELMEAAQAVRDRQMPCDVITLDGRAWQDTATRFAFEWDASRYPDPARVIQALKALDFRICVWEYPLVAVANPLFAYMEDRNWLLRKRQTGAAYRYQWDTQAFGAVLTPLPESGLVDFTHPEAYAFWHDSHQTLLELGVDMIKADFGEQVEDPDILAWNGDDGPRLHNVYALLYNRCVYEACQDYARQGAFLFSRAGWSGSQRYPSQWGGDPQADWGGLAASLRGGLSWGLSGAPFYATDVGGFYGDRRDPELYVRWLQAAVFSAHLRLHGIGAREPWSYGDEAETVAMAALHLRYRLLPYIQQTVRQACSNSLPVMRAMVLAFPDNPEAWAFETQFMFGENLLVAPCLSPGGHVRCYLPPGDWYRFPEGEFFAGGRCHDMQLTLEQMAVFAPQGASIPVTDLVMYTAALPDPIPCAHWVAGESSTLPALNKDVAGSR
ncbi:MAG: glycoside hydrolase family 31 protein [Pseudomonadales bacterium]|nr:glycoside hydrolase family 31 protein [Pseudomonadales bacterium]